MNPLAILLRMLSSTEFKILTGIVIVLIIIWGYLEFQKGRLETKINKQQIKINDRILAGTL